MKRTFFSLLVCAGPAVLPWGGSGAGALAAQTPTAGGLLFTEVELGARAYLLRPEERELARFQKYRDDPSGALLEALRIWWRQDARLIEIRGDQVGQRDHALAFRSARLGLFDLRVERERTPHLLAATGRLLGDEPRAGEFTLPVPRPQLLEHDQGPGLGRTGVRWDTDRLVLGATVRPHVPFRAQYVRTIKSGARPSAMSFGGAGRNFREVLAPVDQTTHDVRLSQELVTARFQVGVAYHVSVFKNALDAVVSDNPLVDQPYLDGAQRGRSALAPSNRAHSLSASGGLNLPYRSRITAAVSYGWRGQNHAMLPHTINPGLADQELAPVPERLAGDVRTLGIQLSGRTRPWAPLTVSARYRLFDLDDRTPDVVLASRVRSDQAVLVGPFERQRYPHSRERAGLDVRLTPAPPLTVGATYAWERWKRDPEAWNTRETRERLPRLTVDLEPWDRIRIRGSYLHARRRADAYQESRDVPLLRRFDQSDRDRERTSVSLELFPLDVLDAALSYDRGKSRYPDSPYGRQADAEEAWAAHLGWSVGDRLSGYASYAREEFRLEQRSRYRGEWPPEPDNPTFDWIGNTDERVRTVGLGGTVSLLPRRLDVSLGWDRSRGSSVMRARNPVPPASPNVENRTRARAQDLPPMSHGIAAGHISLRYRVTDTWTASVRYTGERFTNRDFRTDGLAQATGMDVFLGNALHGYRAHHVTVTVSYHPWIPGIRRRPL